MIPSRTRSKNEYSKIYVYLKRSLFVYIFYLFSWVHLYFFSYLCFKLLIKVWQEGKDSHYTFVLLSLKRGKKCEQWKVKRCAISWFFAWRLHYFLRLFVVVKFKEKTCLARFAILNIDSVVFFFSIYVYVTKRENSKIFVDSNITKQTWQQQLAASWCGPKQHQIQNNRKQYDDSQMMQCWCECMYECDGGPSSMQRFWSFRSRCKTTLEKGLFVWCGRSIASGWEINNNHRTCIVLAHCVLLLVSFWLLRGFLSPLCLSTWDGNFLFCN